MSMQETIANPPFCEMVRASGAAEVWTHSNDDSKLNQFGWRCTNTECLYKTDTLVGNWNEERFDLEKLKVPEPLPSQYGHYFNSVQNSSYNSVPKTTVPKELENLKGRHPHAYCCHQPELDSEYRKGIYNSWKTTQRADYLDPRLRNQPIPQGQTTVNVVEKEL